MAGQRINADFTASVMLETDTLPWIASPQPGVERRMLDRIGDEVARATSLVRYAPGHSFPAHEHALGEEFLVLDGVFSDEHGDYPAGTYVRNPPASRHAPRTAPGCTILVKLRQMKPTERARVVIATDAAAWRPGAAAGHEILPLYSDPEAGGELVAMERLVPACRLPVEVAAGGIEVFVVDGSIALTVQPQTGTTQTGTNKTGTNKTGATSPNSTWNRGAWLRLPPGSRLALTTPATGGATLWIKRRHLSGDHLTP